MEKYIHLKGRLLAISEYVEASKVTADVGCDHGRLAAALIQSGRSQFVYASDISLPSLKKAEELCRKCGLTQQINIRAADGLQGMEDKPDTIIIAGMGGKLIADILSNGSETAKAAEHIILQPMRGIAALRQYLFYNGYEILRDTLCSEAGRIYQVIDAHYTGNKQVFRVLPENCFDIGEYMLTKRDALLPEYIRRLQKELTDAKTEAAAAGISLSETDKRLSDLKYISEVTGI